MFHDKVNVTPVTGEYNKLCGTKSTQETKI